MPATPTIAGAADGSARAGRSRVDRWLEIAAEPGHDTLGALRGFAQILLLHCAARLWVQFMDGGAAVVLSLAVAVTVAAGASLWPRWLRPALVVGAAAMTFRIVDVFPAAPNHLALEALALGVLAAIDLRDEAGRTDALLALRWLAALVLFHTGMQKVLYGTWFDGRFLGQQAVVAPRFGDLLAGLLPAAEWARLSSQDGLTPGSGPYSTRTPLVLAISNATWIFEVLAPAALLYRPTRRVATVAAVGFVLAIQLGAREVFFGLLFGSWLLLFWPRAVHPWGVAPAAAVYGGLLAARGGLLPGFFFN